MTSGRIWIPILLGLAAGILNFMVVREAVAPVDLVVAGRNLKAGDELTLDDLEKLSVQADRGKIRESAVLYENRGTALLERRLKRDVRKGEVIFYEDVRPESDAELQANLKEGERALFVSLGGVPYPSGMHAGSLVGFAVGPRTPVEFSPLPDVAPSTKMPKVKPPRPPETTLLGPFRIVSMGGSTDPRERQGPTSLEERKVIGVAVEQNKAGQLVAEPDTTADPNRLIKALGTSGGERILAVLLYKKKP